jgi:hypothetical protein
MDTRDVCGTTLTSIRRLESPCEYCGSHMFMMSTSGYNVFVSCTYCGKPKKRGEYEEEK